jgi:gamma-glutamyl-gamma-aminobutyraldehyde dehydrogenase
VDEPGAMSDCLRFFAGAARNLEGKAATEYVEGYTSMIRREPLGIVAGICPWNYPLYMAIWKIGPALAAGNSMVVKPSRLSSLSAIRLAELAAEAGLPDGVLNVVPGPGGAAGAALGRHMDVDKVTFTGSTEVGRLFLQYSAESNLKEVTLECGGKSPAVVLADPPDMDLVVEQVLFGALMNMGENCSQGSRLIVHRSVQDELVHRLAAGLEDWPVGDPMDPETKIGPMIERPHMDKVLGYIARGRDEGARVAAGGGRILEETGGYFVAPTIFEGVRNDMTIAREEIFGPVLSTIPFDSEAEGVRLANDTSYGLAAAVFTRDLDAAFRVARALRAGTVGVNAYSEGDITTPFGGFKQSGFGGRDKGLEAIEQYTEKKTIWVTLK